MSLQISEDHWLIPCDRRDSPNYNERPLPAEISLLVVHSISLPAGQFGGPFIEQLFTNCLDCSRHPSFADLEGVEVSAHLLIRRGGELTQFVAFDKRAWHAGQSCFAGCENCNDFSIGIELEGDEQNAYTDAQYHRLAAVTRLLMKKYPLITAERIVGHSDIAPDRKTDPGPGFHWNYFRQLLES